MIGSGQDAPAEGDPRTQQALTKKTEAEARKAEAEARKAEAEAADLESPTGQQVRDAKNRLAVAEAEQKAAAARQQQLSALIPDLSKVKDSTLELGKGGPAIGGNALTFGALADAAKAVADHVFPQVRPGRILITSDHDLASPDSLYHEVTFGLSELAKAADALIKAIDKREDNVTTAAAEPFVTAAAVAVPHILSLLSAERSVATASVTVTDLAAAAAVAGALEAKPGFDVVVVHDEFRLVAPGRVHTASASVTERRQELVTRKIALADRKLATDADLALAKLEEKDAEKALADAAPTTAPHVDLETRLDNARKRVAGLARKSSEDANRLGLLEALISSIDAFSAAIRVIPAGGKRSPLATAALLDQLHEASPSQFTHVLLVKAQAAQTAQLTDDKPLWFEDKFSTLAETSLMYMLISTANSEVIRAGTTTAMAAAHGRLGSEIRIDRTTPVIGVWAEGTTGDDARNRR